jgi:hypothetical protein
MNVNYGYTIYSLLSVNYSGVTDRYLIVMRDKSFRYLTVWNLVSEGLHIAMWSLVIEGLHIAMWNLVSEGLHIAMWNLVRATVWNMMRATISRR